MPCPAEEEWVRFLERALPAGDAASLEAHVDGCAECAAMLAALGELSSRSIRARSARPSLSSLARSTCATRPETMTDGDTAIAPWLPRGAVIGRYVLLETLGAGGMGVVHAAWDPSLDRKVAIKFLRRGRSGRIQDEARALARLAHPNVVAVHDVGEVDGEAFIAMEYVDGVTLDRWLAASPRSPEEIAHVFAEAGRGLAAAHAAGIVHGDFKPRNVMVGPRDRVRVADFGLAHPTGDTHAGAPGTLAYMAPELLRRALAAVVEHPDVAHSSPRVDQFSFCVAMWEALHGSRPFDGATPSVLLAAIEAGPPVARTRLARAIARGLSADSARRYPDMEALLGILAPPPSRSRRMVFPATAAVAVAGALAVGVFGTGGASACRGAREGLAGTWDAARRGAVERAFAGAPWAASATEPSIAALDAWANAWETGWVDACRATRVRGGQSERVLDLRMRCLDRRRLEAAALVDLVSAGDAGVLRNAPSAARSLPSPKLCADVAALEAPLPPPADPGIAKRIAALQTELASVIALREAGKTKDALDRSREIAAAARETGWKPLLAEALVERGDLEGKAGTPEDAENTLLEALWAAAAGGHDRAEAEAAIGLVYASGYLRQDAEAGSRWLKHADAVLERAGGDPTLRGQLLNNRGSLEISRGDPEAAATSFQEALAEMAGSLGEDHPRTTVVLHNLGIARHMSGNSDGALDCYRRALAAAERRGGLTHPQVALASNSLGLLLLDQGRTGDALAAFERALSILEAADANHPDVAMVLANLAGLRTSEGDLEAALAGYQRALAIDEPALGKDHPEVAAILNGIGVVLFELARYAEAAAAWERALGIWEARHGAGYPEAPVVLNNLGAAATAQHQADRARELHRRALASLLEGGAAEADPRAAVAWIGTARAFLADGRAAEALDAARRAGRLRELGGTESSLAVPLALEGRALLAAGDATLALMPLQRAVRLAEEDAVSSGDRAEAQLALAEALRRTGGDPALARMLDARAREALSAGSPHWRRRLPREGL